MRTGELLAALACAAACLAVVLTVLAVTGRHRPPRTTMESPAESPLEQAAEQSVAAPPAPWQPRALAVVGAVWAAAQAVDDTHDQRQDVRPDLRRDLPGDVRSRRLRRRVLVWSAVGVAVWVVTGWPVAGAALVVVAVWRPWLLGAGRVATARIDRSEALEKWCRRMADTLTGGGAVGLAQAVAVTARHADEPIAAAVRVLARDLRDGDGNVAVSLRRFADTLDDRVADTVAAALLLALHQQSVGVAEVLRQLAAGVARDVRARREIEAERAESRQSIRTLLVIQVGLLGGLALVPGFAAPYTTPGGQVVMALLLAATVAVLVWMRQIAVGRPGPRFLGRLPARSATHPAVLPHSPTPPSDARHTDGRHADGWRTDGRRGTDGGRGRTRSRS
jgi:hypothetical protein